MMNTDIEWVGYRPLRAYFWVALRAMEGRLWWEVLFIGQDQQDWRKNHP